MLVLSRKEDESIIINDNIEIKIISVKQDQVKLGIIAPKNVTIYRKEIYEEIQKANIESVNAANKINNLKNALSDNKKKETNNE